MAAGFAPLARFGYPIAWWGLLLALDARHFGRWGVSPMRVSWRQFMGITIPVSVLYWLMYEYVNLAFPQWRYRGDLEGRPLQAAFGFVSFATVVPILIEFYWWFAGPQPRFTAARRGAAIWVAVGIALLAAPFITGHFWISQGAWLAPALVLLPFAGWPTASAVPAGLLSGFLWELLNYWSFTKWEYTIHPDWPRLFEMPLLGYLGFVPFAFSTLAVYAWQRRLRPAAPVVAGLWVAAGAAMYFLTSLYAERGFWAPIKGVAISF
jgi:hypothetical protein